MRTREIDTRFGKVTETYDDKWRGHYQSIFFEGRPDAVFYVIGEHLRDTSTCYEHTFRVRNVESIEEPGGIWGTTRTRLKVECEWTSYVGD